MSPMMRIVLVLLLLCPAGFGQEVRKAVPVSTSTWDARAKFLAGIPLDPPEPLAAMQQRPAYRAHAAEFEKMWARYNEHYFTPMRAWSAAELAPRIPMGAPVIYFFGGPDAITPLACFPDAPDFLLGGLEPVGSVPNPDALPPERLEAAMASLRKSTDVILSFGFFITKNMKSELDAGEFKGVTPIMLVFLAMSGCEVLDISYFGVGGDGHSVECAAGSQAKGELPGVRITFRKNPESAPQRIHYVQANVADEELKSRSGLLHWAGGFGPGNVYLKAASYLLHESYFSMIRSFLLGQARSVLQDDSGIPFSFFQDGEWRVWFFGTYTGTLDIFKKDHQPKLVDAFRTSGVPLPFGTGYKWRVGQSNLLLAVKQAPPKAEAVVTAPSN
ncbi:MAG: hypothetical protein NTV93_18995 [Verrucomicrobia bacterium]|nr:hypothetical protein [Verrucomicrobiota bacterium]